MLKISARTIPARRRAKRTPRKGLRWGAHTGRARAGRVAAFGGWLALNGAGCALALVSPLPPSLVVITVVVVLSPVYVALVHHWDKRHHWFGLRCMGQVAPRKPEPFRRNLRLEILVITSGFSATLFILSLQLYLDLAPERRPAGVLEVMALLFFLSSITNLLQLLLQDFKMATDLTDDRLQHTKARIDRKLAFFLEIGWSALISAIVVAFTFIATWLALAANALYGLLLLHYYFLPLHRSAMAYHNARA